MKEKSKTAPQPNTAPRRRSGQYAGKAASTRAFERKAKLLNAGVHLIGRDGFAATSIDAVCAEAGLTKRYFYEAFDSREALLTAAYEDVTREFRESIMKAAAPYLGDSRKLVRAGLSESFGFVARHPDKARLLMMEAPAARSLLGQVYGARYDDFVDLLVRFTKPFLGGTAPDETTLRVMAKGAIGAIMHLCQGWLATDLKQPIQELINGTERIFGGLGKELGISGWLSD